MLLPYLERQPELRLDLLRLLIQKTARQPRSQRNWQEVEKALVQAEKVLPHEIEKLVLVRVDLLLAQDRQDNAASVLASAQAKDPHNLQYRLALARLAQRKGDRTAALQILERAETELGSSPDLRLARLDYWASEPGDAAKVALAKLAESRGMIADAERAQFLERLAIVEVLRNEPDVARQYWRELLTLQPRNWRASLALFNLAMETADHVDALNLVGTMRKAEGEEGTFWRFAEATLLIDQARKTKDSAEKTSADDHDVLRKLVSELAERRPDWWGVSILSAELAELEGRGPDAIVAYERAIELGNTQPAIVRRLISMLSNENRFDDIEKLVSKLRERGIAAEDLAIATAYSAIRGKDYDRGLALARGVLPARSTRYGDHLALGRMLFSSGKVAEAGKEFRRARELAPAVPETWRAWVEFLARTNQTQAAREAAASAAKALDPAGSSLTLAQCYWTAGEVGKAEPLFLATVKDRPHDAETLRLAASFFLDQNDPDRAAPLVAELLKPETRTSQADLAWAKRTRMMLNFAGGFSPEQVDQALKSVEAELESDPDQRDLQRMRAVLFSMRYCRRHEAIQALESMDREYGLTSRDRLLLAKLYSAERDWPKLRIEIGKLLEEGAGQPRNLVFCVNWMTRLGQLDEAERWLRILKPLLFKDQAGVAMELEARLLKARNQIASIAPLIRNYVERYPDLVEAAALLLDRLNLPKEAEQAYRASLARSPSDPRRTLALIEHLARQDRPQEALDLCEPALKAWRPEIVALAGLAITRSRSVTEPQRRKVEGWLEEAVHQQPDNIFVNTKLGLLRSLQGDYQEAEAIFRRILSANRDNVEAMNNLAWLLAHRDKSAEEALKLVDRAIDVAGPNPSLLDTRAVVLLQIGQGDKAREALQEAVSSDPDKSVCYYHLARTLQMTNLTSEARKALEQSRVLGLTQESVDHLEREEYRKLCLQMALR